MAAPFPDVKGTRLAAATHSIELELSRRLIGARDQIGLWDFARRRGDRRDHRQLLALGPPDQARLDQMSARLRALRPTGDSDLTGTIRAAAGHLRSGAGRDPAGDPAANALIVIADGADAGPSAADLADLTDELVSGEPVRVFVIAFRQESCAAGLDDVTRDSGGACFEIDGMTSMRRALDEIGAGLWGNPR